jgi:ribosome-binding protein aMBF1 (putative translation factor)
MECNLCGKNVAFLNKVDVEGVIIDVCDRCVSFGQIVLSRQMLTKA